MTTLTQASQEWARRPNDERFVSLSDLLEHCRNIRSTSRAAIVPSRSLSVIPGDDHRSLSVVSRQKVPYNPTHWAFSQLATLAESPAGYLRTLPAELAADCLNFGLQVKRESEDVGVLLSKNGSNVMRAATGPRYGRIWNADIAQGLVERFGDGITGNWRVPGEFGKRVTITKANTTLYASDRDMFVFLADEDRRITIPNRRDGKAGSLARGFFVWNSEVGAATLGISTFLYDYVCCNRMVWGATDVKELKIRHTSGAPERWIDEIVPALRTYAESSATGVQEAIADARAAKIESDLDKFLSTRFGKGAADKIKTVHVLEEGRPIETRWDVVVGATAYARGVEYQDARVEIEREAGKLLTR